MHGKKNLGFIQASFFLPWEPKIRRVVNSNKDRYWMLQVHWKETVLCPLFYAWEKPWWKISIDASLSQQNLRKSFKLIFLNLFVCFQWLHSRPGLYFCFCCEDKLLRRDTCQPEPLIHRMRRLIQNMKFHQLGGGSIGPGCRVFIGAITFSAKAT